MENMKMIFVVLGLVAVASAAPQFTPSQYVPVGASTFDNQGSSGFASAAEDSTDSALETSTSAFGASSDVSSSGSVSPSLTSLIYGKPSITDDAQPSSSFGGSSPFSSSAQDPSSTDLSSGVGASSTSRFARSSDLSSSASDTVFASVNPSPISGADAASPISTSVSSSVSSSKPSGAFGSSAGHQPSSVFQAANDFGLATEAGEVTTEESSSGDSSFNSSGNSASNPKRTGFFSG